jgi:RNA polymerase sigma factor (sigma-70 family)
LEWVHCAPDERPEPFDGFEPCELELVLRQVEYFFAERRLPSDVDVDDLFQECLLHWWKRRDGYEAGRGALRKTFLRKVVRAKLQDLARGWRARRRGSGGRPISLDAPASRRAPDGATIGEALHDGGDLASNVSAAVDVESLIARLSARQQRIVAGVKAGTNNTELSRQMGISRDTLQEELRRIRQVFREEGLAPYLD